MTWDTIKNLIISTGARNVYVAGDTLRGNDGLILTYDPRIASRYVMIDWDAINCTEGKPDTSARDAQRREVNQMRKQR